MQVVKQMVKQVVLVVVKQKVKQKVAAYPVELTISIDPVADWLMQILLYANQAVGGGK